MEHLNYTCENCIIWFLSCLLMEQKIQQWLRKILDLLSIEIKMINSLNRTCLSHKEGSRMKLSQRSLLGKFLSTTLESKIQLLHDLQAFQTLWTPLTSPVLLTSQQQKIFCSCIPKGLIKCMDTRFVGCCSILIILQKSALKTKSVIIQYWCNLIVVLLSVEG